MKNLKKYIGFLLYKTIAIHLPVSYAKINFGANEIRVFCCKLIIKKCGKSVNIERGAVFPSTLTLGNNSGLGINCKIGGSVAIGDDVLMGADCVILTRNHRFDDLSRPMRQQGYFDDDPVSIGNDVWIGSRVTILPGVRVGNGAILGACSVVTKDVPDYAIVVGNPARVVQTRK